MSACPDSIPRVPAPRRARRLRPRLPALCLPALCLWALGTTGCALQSEMMEMETDVTRIKTLQHDLEKGVADAKEAAESMRAVGFRLEAVEAKLKAGMDPQLQGRIDQGLKALDGALDDLARERKATEARLKEAETFFVDRLEQVSSREQGLSNRVAALEESGTSPTRRAARADAAAEVSVLRAKLAEQAEALDAMQGEFGLLTDRVAQVAAARAAKPGAAPPDAVQALEARLAAVEARTGEAVAGQQRLADQVALLADRLAAPAPGAAAPAGPDLTALEARLKALEERDAARAEAARRGDERLVSVVDRMAELGTAQGQADKARAADAEAAAALATRVAALEAARTEAAATRATVSEQAAKELAGRLTALERADAEAARSRAALGEQVRNAAAALEAVTAQAGQAAGAATATAARLDALEQGGAESARARDRLAERMSALDGRLAALEKGDLDTRMARLEGAGGQIQRLGELTDQLALLGSQVTERLDAQASDFARLAARIDRAEQGVEGFQEAPPEWGAALDKKVTFLADELTPRVDTQSRELTALAGTVAAVREQSESQSDVFSDRINTLGTSLVQRMDGLEERVTDVEKAGPPPGGAPAVQARLDTLGRQVDVLGREVPGRVDDLGTAVARLSDQLERVGQRIALLETIQKQDAADLRERFNALSAALADVARAQAAP